MIMKKNFFTLFAGAFFTVMLLCSCNAVQASKNNPSVLTAKQEKLLKVGYFVGDGSNGNGVFHWARLLKNSPQLDVTLLVGEDIRNGKLDDLDLLVIPGGSSRRQYLNVTEKGGDKIREFVKKGGSYVGICAGFHCTLDKPDRFRLMPYTYRKGAGGYRAKVAIDINERGAELLDIKKGRYFVTYSRGPISKEVKEWEHGKAETLGIYRSTVSHIGVKSNFMNAPAMIYGNYGKGKVIATSFHPEMHRENDPVSMGCIYAVTGIRPTPVYPAKVYRPVRVAFLSTYTVGKEPIRLLWELDKEKELDVRLLGESELSDGMLLNTDVVVMPDINAKGKKNTLKKYKKDFEDFLARGGRIVAGKRLADALPKHKNVTIIPSGASFVQEALKKP